MGGWVENVMLYLLPHSIYGLDIYIVRDEQQSTLLDSALLTQLDSTQLSSAQPNPSSPRSISTLQKRSPFSALTIHLHALGISTSGLPVVQIQRNTNTRPVRACHLSKLPNQANLQSHNALPYPPEPTLYTSPRPRNSLSPLRL